ncbi:DUF5808 domain-containing protein [[Clostridium] fimetarium]|uniref:Uncharacterized membrane protein n=1 Tax=[Clostridium] fimetarium TaxID=99656 RepID=A0A1I0PGZ3_9FIRM|nr:DUF5808 domain-containing protein [[Clostridium] fimetarium]SEW13646.1 Uncharacterized membrane protein [[Clostridium] fimetarium]
MIWSFLIIYWVVLGAMTASALLFRKYQNYKILGITFSQVHAKTMEVQKVLKSYQAVCMIQFVASFAAGLLMFWGPVKPYVDFYMLLLTFILLIVISVIIKTYQDKLIALKESNKWIYPAKATVLVDLDASREKGKSAVSVLWSWFFVVLSFIPTIYLVLNPDTQKYYPFILSLLGPAIQLLMVLMYRQTLNHHTLVLSENSEINKALARTQERINSMASTLIGMIMLLFWLILSTSIAYITDIMLGMCVVGVMIISILVVAYWQQKKIRQAEEYFFENSRSELFDGEDGNNDIYEQGNLWKWGLYNNPNDSRLFVPKRIAGLGWTINMAKPIGKIFMIGVCLLVVGAIGITVASSLTGYEVQENNSKITVSSVMYHSTFTADEIISVKMITQIPECTRTNGYGGATKSSGHFSVNGYGPCMFYIYNDVNEYIVIQLKGEGPQYVFVNGKTIKETDKLYDYFNTFLK